MQTKKKKILVFTCITDNYDSPTLNSKLQDGIDYYCFTDSIVSVHEGWKMRSLAGLDHLNKKDQNRFIKMHPRACLPSHDYSIYVDGYIEITGDLKHLINELALKEKLLFLYEHPFRNCIYEEAETCIYESLDWIWRITKQMRIYSKKQYPQNNGLFENNIIIRKNTDKLDPLMDRWWKEYCNQSKRDQLSLNYCTWELGEKISSLGPSDIREKGKYFYLSLSKRTRGANLLIIIRMYFHRFILRLFNVKQLFGIK